MYGVYVISNNKKNKHYISSSAFPDKRLHEHREQLLDNKHVNTELQKDFNDQNGEDFEFKTLEDGINNEDLKIKENEYAEYFKSNGSKTKNKPVRLYEKKSSEGFKNAKIDSDMHYQLKIISSETGINMSKLLEMASQKLIDSYHSGEFDNLKPNKSNLRRNGSISRK